ncbi:hypothetical protein [Caballeronia cordobensis]|uniref:hypothetical protein n=1 Tax=Caballeronia cordobensis TaxID=1353886 RepID=UPI000A028863
MGAWLRPRIARRLNGEGIRTLGELVAFQRATDSQCTGFRFFPQRVANRPDQQFPDGR